MTKQDRHAVFMYTATFTAILLALYMAGYAIGQRDAYIELAVDNVVLTKEITLLNRSVAGGKQEIAELRKAAATAGRACGFRPPVRKPDKKVKATKKPPP